MAATSFTRSLNKGLLAFLRANIPALIEGYEEFPNASQNLKFPSVSVFLQSPDYNPVMPYVISVGAPDANKNAIVKRVVGRYEFKMQLDFWCENKFQKHDIYQAFIEAFNKDLVSSGVGGITFTLADYHNEKVHIDIDGVDFSIDGELSAQRNEWRFKIDVSGNARCVKQTLEPLMVTIDRQVTTESI